MSVFLIVPFNVRASGNVPIYQLDTKIPELNNYTLRQVFENRNITMPDLSTATDLGGGDYRLYNTNGITLDYNTFSGIYTINGTSIVYMEIDIFNILPNTEYAVSYIAISGSLSGGRLNIYVANPFLLVIYQLNENTSKQNTFLTTNQTRFIFLIDVGRTFINYQFKLQLEHGSTVTPYQIPTNGPYNDLDVSQFGLTQQQLEYYFNLYQLAVKYELDNRSAVKDEGNYKTIFQSIYDGLLNLMRSMGAFWQFINRPIMLPEFTSLTDAFQIDWSWNLLDVIRQVIVNIGTLILMGSFQSISLVFSILGLDIRVSILSLVFSNLIFVLLGWIIIKSFII